MAGVSRTPRLAAWALHLPRTRSQSDVRPVSTEDRAARVLILGGGIAGLEALLAIRDLAADRTEVTLVAAEPDFTYKPLIVEEPFTYQPAERHELEPAVRELGARFVRGVARAVRPDAHAVVLTEGEGYDFGHTRELAYDLLVVCVGGRSHAAYEHAVTFRFRSVGDPLEVDDLIARAEAHDSRTLAFVVPPGVTWSLPLYELALLTRRRAEETGRRDLRLAGADAGGVTADPVREAGKRGRRGAASGARRSSSAAAPASENRTTAGCKWPRATDPIDAGAVAALPVIEGPRLPGLPCDERGFIPIDEHARVAGLDECTPPATGRRSRSSRADSEPSRPTRPPSTSRRDSAPDRPQALPSGAPREAAYRSGIAQPAPRPDRRAG